MTTTSVPTPSAGQTEAALQVFQTAAHPLTLTQAQKRYRGPKLTKQQFSRIVEDGLLMAGQLFKCSPSRKQARFWVQDEEEKVRETVEGLLGKGPLPERKLVTATNKALPKISSPAAIKSFVQAMAREGFLHEWPSKGKTRALALRPFDPLAGVTFKKATLKDLSDALARLEPLGVSVDRFLQVLRQHLRPHQDASRDPALTPPPPPGAGDGEPRGEHPPSAEIDELILKGMRDLDPAVERGATVLLRDLRLNMPQEYGRHETFDGAVIRLAEAGRVVLHRHDHPAMLTDAERDELVRDQAGTYYTSIGRRV
jgi:hypothetical protein